MLKDFEGQFRCHGSEKLALIINLLLFPHTPCYLPPDNCQCPENQMTDTCNLYTSVTKYKIQQNSLLP